ncbi:MAG: cysteine--tRNA ligase, partial [Bacteroidales bacterium]|nr:cysteine--tRNA ligase [Bacteroidales bacterium]
HECEIAQAVASQGDDMVKYWMQCNMLTVGGQKMGKSLGNFITLNEFFSGTHKSLTQAYSPMTIRFFILQAHYRSTVDFTNEALQASEKGLQRLLAGIRMLDRLQPSATSTADISQLQAKCYEAMNDDLNSPMVIAHLFDGLRIINLVHDGKATLSGDDLAQLRQTYHTFAFDILGLKDEETGSSHQTLINDLISYILEIRQNAKQQKDYATSDQIRDRLQALGVELKDRKDGTDWNLKV